MSSQSLFPLPPPLLPTDAPAEPDLQEVLACLQTPANEFTLIIDGGHSVSSTTKMRKQFIEYRLQVRKGAMEQSYVFPAIAKVYASERGAYAYQVLIYLWAHGFQEDAAYAVPRPLGFLPERRLLLQGKAAGALLADWLYHPRAGPGASRDAARWLAHLHRLPAEPGLAFQRADPTAALERYRRELQRALPEQAARLDRLFPELLERLQESARQESWGLIHGDYHAKNIFLNDGQVTVIDFDTFGLGEPAQDLGYFLAQTTIMAWLRHANLRLADAPGQAFLDEYLAQGKPLNGRRVAAYIARTFLQSLHYEICVLRTGNLQLVDLWLDLAEGALAGATQAKAGLPLRIEGAG